MVNSMGTWPLFVTPHPQLDQRNSILTIGVFRTVNLLINSTTTRTI